jgi:carbamate kinase
MRIVIALGGNAMTSADGSIRPVDQLAAVDRAAGPIADLVAGGHEVVLTHGNGPQVGNLLFKNELSAPVVPPVPLDWCGAQVQGTIGMMLLNALDAALARRGTPKPVVALVSRTLVDPGDEGFRKPTKPIGRYLTEEDTAPLREEGQQFVEVPSRGWRRVVASPEPLECLDAPAADTLLAQGYLVVCSGGGGIPTVRREDGRLDGVEAVIDKDLTAALIATHLKADVLLIATDVDNVVENWGTPDARPVLEVEPRRMREIAAEQRFAAGSMGPKVEAVTRFAEACGGTGIITSLQRLPDALSGAVGTRVVPASS